MNTSAIEPLAASDRSVNESGPTLHETERLQSLRPLQEILGQASADDGADAVCKQQRADWQNGNRTPIETYLDNHPELRKGPQAIALIYGEYLLREELGEWPTVEEYQERFPSYATQLGEQIRLHRLLAFSFESPTPTHRYDSGQTAPSLASLPTILPNLPGFELVSELGRGGMGVVYKARQLGLNRLVAIKMIRGGEFADADAQARFRDEAEVIAKLQHPNIVQVFTIGTQQSPLGEGLGCPYFVEEFVEGGNLAECLAGKPQSPADAAWFIEVLARAVHYAHERGILHRDLKPANILLSLLPQQPCSNSDEKDLSTPGSLRSLIPKITDFGLAKQLDVAVPARTIDGTVLGTPEYIAPEVARGDKAIGPGVDIYALGVILYEMLTGRRPFQGTSALDTFELARQQEPVPPRRLQPKTPLDLQTICLQCLAKNPQHRYPSAVALANDLQRFQSGEPIEARPAGFIERSWRWAKRRPAVAALLAAIVLLSVSSVCSITVALLYALSGWREADHQRHQAVVKQSEAEEQRRRTQEEQVKAERRREEAESSLYISRIAQARLEARQANFATAGQLLDLCLPRDSDSKDRRAWEWHYLRGLLHSDLLTIPSAHFPIVSDVALSPDGEWLATAGGSPFGTRPSDRVRVWRAFGPEAGTSVCEFPHPTMVMSVVFAKGGQDLVWAGMDRLVVQASLKTHQVSQTRVLPRGFSPATLSPDGRFYAAWSSGQRICVWEIDSGQEILSVPTSADSITLAFAADGKRLAIHTDTLRVWDVAAGRELRNYPHSEQRQGRPAFSPNGALLALGSPSGLVRIYETETGYLLHSLSGHSGGVLAVTFCPDSRWLCTAGSDQAIRVWDARSGAEIRSLVGHQGRISSLCFHPSGNFVASGGEQPGDVKVWDLTRPQEYLAVHLPPQELGDLGAIGFDEEAGVLRISSSGGWLYSNRADTGVSAEPTDVPVAKRWIVPSVRNAFSADARLFATVDNEDPRLVNLHDTRTGIRLHRLEHDHEALNLAFSRDGRRLGCSASRWTAGVEERQIKVWDTTDGRAVAAIPCRRLPIANPNGVAALSADGRYLAFDECTLRTQQGRQAEFQAEVVLYELSTGQRLQLQAFDSLVRCLAFSPDDRSLAIATERHGISVYDIGTQRWFHREPLSGSDAETKWELAYSPDGRRLAAVSRTQVHLWDLSSGQLVLVLRGAPPRHRDVGFNPRIVWNRDGSRLAATNWNRTASIWDTAERETPAAKQAMHRNAAARGR
jgi:serine/threonine protein kinase/WD40 repeat protein